MPPQNSPFNDLVDDEIRPNPTPCEGLAMERMGFIEFWKTLTFDPVKFFRANFRPSEWSRFETAFLLLVFGNGISQVEHQRRFTYDAALDGQTAFLTDSWGGYAFVAFALGVVGALLHFYIGGLFYNFRISWCGGQMDYSRAKFLYLYSMAFPCFYGLLVKLFEAAIHPAGPDFSPSPRLEFTALLLLFASIYAACVSIAVSYSGVREITSVRRRPAIFWFVICPVIYLFLVVAVGVGLALVLSE
jgi:hypothetical protein